MKRFFSLMVLSLVLALVAFPLLVAPCYAMEGDAGALGPALATFVQNVVIPLVGVLLSFFLPWVLTRLGKWLGVKFKNDQADLLEKVAWNAIGFVEEYATRKLKESNIRITSSDKLNMAAAQVLARIPKIPEVQAREVVEAMLARAKGVGATGDQAI